MADKKVEITQDMCRQAQLMIKGGATNKEAASFLGVSPATVSRIRSANYDLFKYLQNTEARRKEEKKPSLVPDYFKKEAVEHVVPDYVEDKEHQGEFHMQMRNIEEKKDEDQVPGQLSMDLNDDSITAKFKDFVMTARERAFFEKVEQMVYDNQLKLSKAVYGASDRTAARLERYMRETGSILSTIGLTLDKLNDNLCQILRRMDK